MVESSAAVSQDYRQQLTGQSPRRAGVPAGAASSCRLALAAVAAAPSCAVSCKAWQQQQQQQLAVSLLALLLCAVCFIPGCPLDCLVVYNRSIVKRLLLACVWRPWPQQGVCPARSWLVGFVCSFGAWRGVCFMCASIGCCVQAGDRVLAQAPVQPVKSTPLSHWAHVEGGAGAVCSRRRPLAAPRGRGQ
jgi:hypothetical protein